MQLRQKKIENLLLQSLIFSNLNRNRLKMGLIKPNNYSKEELKFSKIANALGHPARTRIIELIQEELLVTQTSLVSHLNLNKASIHRHINCLRRANLLLNKYKIHYDMLYLNEETLKQFEKRLQKLSKAA